MEPSLNLEETLERFGGDWEMLREVVALFLESYSSLVDDVRVAVGQRDASRLHHAAHALKGALTNFSRQAADAAARLEALGRSGELEGCEQAFATLEEQLARLVPELAALVTEKVC